MKVSKNLIVTDTKPGDEWDFDKILSHFTGLEWSVLDGGLQYKLWNSREKIKRYLNFFWFPFRLFLGRKRIENLVAWQQYYGLMYALYCMVFHVPKENYCMIMTFIYRQRTGLLGKLQKKVTAWIVNSRYVDRILVYSRSEKEYYQKILGINGDKFLSARLGLEDLTKGIEKRNRGNYILSAGRSNRDYDFLIRALQGGKQQVKIVCDALPGGKEKNIQIYDNVYYEKFFQMIADCYCVVIALKNSDISSGQLVILQAMQFGKPVIVTQSRAVADYLSDGEEGFLIPKDEQSLREKIDLLYNDKELYNRMSAKARESYEKNFSMRSLGKQVADCFERDMRQNYGKETYD